MKFRDAGILSTYSYKEKIRILFIPLFIALALGLYRTYDYFDNILKDQHMKRVDKTAALLDGHLHETMTDMGKVASLIASNRTVLEYMYLSVILNADNTPLRNLMEPIYQSLGLDTIILYDMKGNELVELDNHESNDEHYQPIRPIRTDKTVSGIRIHHGMMQITSFGALTYGGKRIGYIEAGKYIDDTYINKLKQLSGNEIIARTTGKTVSSIDANQINADLNTDNPHDPTGSFFLKKIILKDFDNNSSGEIILALPGMSYKDTRSKIGAYCLMLFGGSFLLFLFISQVFISTLEKPLERVVLFIKGIADGDYANHLSVFGTDEIAELTKNCNLLQAKLSESRQLSDNYTSTLENAILEKTAQLENTQKQLLHSQKMDAIGQMAGGVAHDFNNLLTVIMGYSNLLRTKLSGNIDYISYIDQVISASEKAATLTSSLLAFSRKQPTQLSSIEINNVVANMNKLLIRLLREDIHLETRPSKDRLFVMADRGQIEQVLMNMITNARDAMRSCGNITINTDRVQIDEAMAVHMGIKNAGSFACISITDTGEGIAPEIRDRIFDPFFTTKDVGKGTGLGLSMAYGIISNHNGFINLISEQGKGTTFEIYLPIHEQVQSADMINDMPAITEIGTGGVLVVEDEQQVRELLSEVLKSAGYSVFQASNGVQAIEVFRKHSDDIRIVVTDLIMPEMNGRDMALQLRTMRPDIMILFMSGYTADIAISDNIIIDADHFLSKPVTPSTLLKKLGNLSVNISINNN